MKKKPQRAWAPEEYQILREHYPVGGSPLVQAKMQEAGLQIRSKPSIGGMAHHMGIRSGLLGKPNSGCFQKGQTPPNKGKSMSKALRKKVAHTWFQKGQLPVNTLYDFAVSLRKSKAIKGEFSWYIRVGLAKWELLNRWAWSELYGDIPRKHVVSMRPGFEDLVQQYFPENPPKKEPPRHWQTLCKFVRQAAPYLELITMKENYRRNWDEEKSVAALTATSKELTDNYVAGIMTPNDPALRKILKTEYPTLIRARRQAILNHRAAKSINK